MAVVMGIDPGVTGAVAVVAGVHVAAFSVMPTRAGPAGRRRIDARKLRDIVTQMVTDLGVEVIVIEEPSALPKQGVSSSFGFGRSVGVCEGVAVGVGVRLEMVAPATWKRQLRVPADKKQARARASDLLPASRSLWARASEDGIAEAAMLALWGAGIRSTDLFAGVG